MSTWICLRTSPQYHPAREAILHSLSSGQLPTAVWISSSFSHYLPLSDSHILSAIKAHLAQGTLRLGIERVPKAAHRQAAKRRYPSTERLKKGSREFKRFYVTLAIQLHLAGAKLNNLEITQWPENNFWHAKVFIGKDQNGTALAVVGSSNLTKASFGVGKDITWNYDCDVVMVPSNHTLSSSIKSTLDAAQGRQGAIILPAQASDQQLSATITQLENELRAATTWTTLDGIAGTLTRTLQAKRHPPFVNADAWDKELRPIVEQIENKALGLPW